MPDKRAKFDPYEILQALDSHRVSYVLIGGLARVLQGTEEITRGVDIVPSVREENLRRLDAAIREVGARLDRRAPEPMQDVITEHPVVRLTTNHGEMKIVPTPTGTRGFDDLRRGASREPLGHGVRPQVASIGDLARMSTALGTERSLDQVRQLRRLTALERSRGRVIERS